MTSDQFCELPPSDAFKLELLDGEVVMAARPVPTHQHFLGELYVVLLEWTKKRKLGRVLFDTLMKVEDDWTPAPDLCFLKTAHLKRVEKKRIVGSVDPAVEILSAGSKDVDRETKFMAYARFGIPWHWIVDLDHRILEEYELVGTEYGDPLKVPFDRPFAPRLFPRLRIDLASLEW
ncbi:MAG: Uma2 family endonuclease [Gemmataceae bacterium]|nr:Uma2 family endonuclease [Gemmataceae bacterium]